MASNPSPTPRSIASHKSSFNNKNEELDGLLYELQEEESTLVRKRDGLQGFEQGERSILEDASVNPGLIPLEEHELMQFEQEQDTTGNQGAQDLGDYVLENSLHSQNREERKDASEF